MLMRKGGKMTGTTTSNGKPATSSGCSKCSGPLDTSGAPLWCKSCRAQYQRDYKAIREEMSESRGYASGISAMREHLSKQFERLGSGTFSGYEAAQLIRQARGPAFIDVPEDSTPV